VCAQEANFDITMRSALAQLRQESEAALAEAQEARLQAEAAQREAEAMNEFDRALAVRSAMARKEDEHRELLTRTVTEMGQKLRAQLGQAHAESTQKMAADHTEAFTAEVEARTLEVTTAREESEARARRQRLAFDSAASTMEETTKEKLKQKEEEAEQMVKQAKVS
jgi:hypothetical protein